VRKLKGGKASEHDTLHFEDVFDPASVWTNEIDNCGAKKGRDGGGGDGVLRPICSPTQLAPKSALIRGAHM
jgi:hypothetical protein